MKVLWFSNCVLTNPKFVGSGSWLYAMSNLISTDVELYNITESGVSEISKYCVNNIVEYVLPTYPLVNGVPAKENINKIKAVVDEVNPDIIHIWGIEKYWALLFVRGYIKQEPIVEIQGLLSSCYDVYWGGMTPLEVFRINSGIKEILKPSTALCLRKKVLKKRANYEREILSRLKVFSTQSQWTRDQLHSINASAQTFNTKRPIRNIFWEAEKWNKKQQNELIVFTSIGYYEPFKGVHILLKAIKELEKRELKVILKIAGPDITKIENIRLGGYERSLLSFIRENYLQNNVVFLGRTNAAGLVKQLQEADVFVNPSFVESYSASTAEALCLGVPTVLSYAGAMPEFTDLLKTALCYSSMDYKSCAAKIEKCYLDRMLCKKMSVDAIKTIEVMCSSQRVKRAQLDIYREFKSL